MKIRDLINLFYSKFKENSYMNLKFKVLSQRPLSLCGLDTSVTPVFFH